MCSTPFGIRDSTRMRTILPKYRAVSAQRLSASEIRHALISANSLILAMCSTPFGIRDSTPPYLCILAIHQDVLNAFRHQRFDTKAFPEQTAGLYGAQRLSASEIRHFFNRCAVAFTATKCSTPFGIRDSTRSTHTSIKSQ